MNGLKKALLLTVFFGFSLSGQGEVICDRPIEFFEKSNEFGMPEGWVSHSSSDLKRAQRDKIYQIEKDPLGFSFLKAKAVGGGVIYHLPIEGWDLNSYPILQWQWRVNELPQNGDESKSSVNDAGAAVYAIWKASFVMKVKSIKMTWSSTLPIGTHIPKRLNLDHVHVLQSGDEKKGQWVEQTVNIRDLAKEYYPKETANPIAIAVMSDGDDTKSPSAGDYARFTLCKKN